jgi:hypothetical protein
MYGGFRDRGQDVRALVQGGEQLVPDVLADVPEDHGHPLQRVRGGLRGAAELLVHLGEDDLLRLEGVPGADEGLHLRLLRRRERDADAAERGHSLDRVVQGLPEEDRRLFGALRRDLTLVEAGGEVRRGRRGLVEYVVPLADLVPDTVNVSSMFAPD